MSHRVQQMRLPQPGATDDEERVVVAAWLFGHRHRRRHERTYWRARRRSFRIDTFRRADNRSPWGPLPLIAAGSNIAGSESAASSRSRSAARSDSGSASRWSADRRAGWRQWPPRAGRRASRSTSAGGNRWVLETVTASCELCPLRRGRSHVCRVMGVTFALGCPGTSSSPRGGAFSAIAVSLPDTRPANVHIPIHTLAENRTRALRPTESPPTFGKCLRMNRRAASVGSVGGGAQERQNPVYRW